ncbi:hypothetical protein [Reyranella sp.]|uniref:hypothetical protein n=1 Tax=Reyranella sp. TaxID=1929291 RepID=UPI003D099762
MKRHESLSDQLDDAYGDLEGTLNILSKLIDHDCEVDAGVIVTMERHLKADFAALGSVVAKAAKAIRRGIVVLEEPRPTVSSPLSLAVDNEGGDHAA